MIPLKWILGDEHTSPYDQIVKAILRHPFVFAKLLQTTVDAYSSYSIKSYSIKEIVEQFLIRHPSSDELDRFVELNTEVSRINDGLVRYDLLTYVLHPFDGGIYVDIEAQNKISESVLYNRNKVYEAQGILNQLKGSMSQLYNELKPFVRIWILFNPPKGKENTIEETWETVKLKDGKNNTEKIKYGKMLSVRIYLGKEINREIPALELCGILFSNTLSKEEIMQQLYKLDPQLVDEELESEVNEMCDLGLMIQEESYNDGIVQGRSEGRAEGLALGTSNTTFRNILSTMKKLHYSLKEAMDFLDVDESEYSIYEEKYKALNH